MGFFQKFRRDDLEGRGDPHVNRQVKASRFFLHVGKARLTVFSLWI